MNLVEFTKLMMEQVQIWVITKRSVPSKDAQLGIKGKIQNGVNYNGKNYGLVLIEDDRRFKKN